MPFYEFGRQKQTWVVDFCEIHWSVEHIHPYLLVNTEVQRHNSFAKSGKCGKTNKYRQRWNKKYACKQNWCFGCIVHCNTSKRDLVRESELTTNSIFTSDNRHVMWYRSETKSSISKHLPPHRRPEVRQPSPDSPACCWPASPWPPPSPPRRQSSKGALAISQCYARKWEMTDIRKDEKGVKANLEVFQKKFWWPHSSLNLETVFFT